MNSVSDISVVVNSKVGLLRDNIDYIINDLESWINNLSYQTKKEPQIKKERCEVCNSKEDSSDLELHHIAGRKHDWRKITSCLLCHAELSLMQKKWDIQWLKPNQSESIRQAFFLQGLQDILILKSKKTGNFHYEKYAILLIEEISKRLKSR